jgi:septal ring factor EnvC (AmiA/AmiB activator)
MHEQYEQDRQLKNCTAELTRLRAKIERLRQQRAQTKRELWALVDDLSKQIDDRATEIERLTAENEQLRQQRDALLAALREIEKQATANKPPRYSWFGETAYDAIKLVEGK